MDIPKHPVVFTKQATSAKGPYSPIHSPNETNMLDYEGELAVVIGKRCRRVSKADASKVIAGFCVLNDVSVREWQFLATPPQFTMGKSWDTHNPFGPAIGTPDEVDPHNLMLRTLVNGELRQETNTDDLSPAQDAWSRPDIPLHAQSMLKNPRQGVIPDKDYEILISIKNKIKSSILLIKKIYNHKQQQLYY